MVQTDLYEDLCKYYELQFQIWKREEFKGYLKEMATPDELAVYFLLPLERGMTLEEHKEFRLMHDKV